MNQRTSTKKDTIAINAIFFCFCFRSIILKHYVFVKEKKNTQDEEKSEAKLASSVSFDTNYCFSELGHLHFRYSFYRCFLETEKIYSASKSIRKLEEGKPR